MTAKNIPNATAGARRPLEVELEVECELIHERDRIGPSVDLVELERDADADEPVSLAVQAIDREQSQIIQ